VPCPAPPGSALSAALAAQAVTGHGVEVSEQDMRAAVAWTVEDAPRGLAVARGLNAVLHAVSTVATLGADATSGSRSPTWSVPADPDAFVDMGVVRLTGRAGWLPPSLGPTALVTATQRDVWIGADRAERPTHRLPVETLRVVTATSRSRSRRPRQARAPWTLTVTDGTDPASLDGAWLALAWIGHLASWPEPVGERPFPGA
jgi:hypothetical protein